MLYDSGDVALPQPDRDVILDVPNVPGVRRARFTPTADQSCNPGFAELKVIGVFGDAGEARVVEGESLHLSALFHDTNPDGPYTATVDWGDGASGPAPVIELGLSGLVEADHSYLDDGVLPAEICVTDSTPLTGCSALDVIVDNAPPDVNDDRDIDLRLFQVESFNPGTQSNWVVAADGRSVLQVINSSPSVFYGDFLAFGTRVSGTIRVEDSGSDDDFIGFTLGFEPGDGSNSDADFLLVDWKRANQTVGPYSGCSGITALGKRGLAVSRASGVPHEIEFWSHFNEDCNGLENGLEELARGATLGNTGWGRQRDYKFTFEFNAERLRVFVDGNLEIDITGEFANGRLTFYNNSQANVRYKAFSLESLVVDEGSPVDLQVSFTDQGLADTHIAVIDWADGSSSPGDVIAGGSSNVVQGTHVYGDNQPDFGDYLTEVTVTDDDGGTDSGFFPILVRNVVPAVAAGPDAAFPLGGSFALDQASFVDPGFGFADTIPEHTTVVAGSVTSDRGTVDSDDPVTVTIGEIAGGMDVVTVNFRVLVDDPIAAGAMDVVNQGVVTSAELAGVLTDDPEVGGDADPTETMIQAEPDLRVEKVDVLFDDADGDGVASPGDVLLYQLTVDNDGNTAATGVTLADPMAANLSIEAGSVQTSQGTILSEDPVEVALGQVDVGVTATVSFRVTVDDPFEVAVTEVTNQATVASVELETVASDDPETAAAGDATATEVFITPEISIDDVTVSEGDPGDVVEAAFTVSLSEAGNRPVTVSYQTAAGGSGLPAAGADLDYASAAGSVVFAPGETSQTIPVTIIADLLDEPDETFIVTLADADGGTLADGEGTGTILDDDPPPQVSIAGATVTEGDLGTSDAIFTVTLSAASGFDVTVDYLTIDGGSGLPAAVAGLDYEARAGTVLIPAGSQIATIAVPVLGDLIDEPDETFTVQLTAAVNGVLAVPVATGTILDDDDPPVLTIGDVTVTEGDPGDLVEASFMLSLSLESGWEIRVDYATSPATAAAGSDYAAVAGTLILPAGTTAATVTVPVASDLIDEPDETFSVELTSPVRVTVADASGLGTILDDDPPPILSVSDVTVTEGTDAAAVFTVSLSLESGFDVTVDYQTADGGSGNPAAVAGLDYTSASGSLSFRRGRPALR